MRLRRKKFKYNWFNNNASIKEDLNFNSKDYNLKYLNS